MKPDRDDAKGRVNQPVPPDPHIAVWPQATLGTSAIELAVVVGHQNEATLELRYRGVGSGHNTVLKRCPFLICIELHETAV